MPSHCIKYLAGIDSVCTTLFCIDGVASYDAAYLWVKQDAYDNMHHGYFGGILATQRQWFCI